MVVVLLCIVLVFVAVFGLIWAYGTIREEPEVVRDERREFEGPGHPRV